MAQELMRTYSLTGAEIGGLSAFYYHAYVPMQIVVGLLMDRFGPRRLLTVACLCCVVGTYLFAGTPYLAVAEFGRFLVGFGSAFAFVGALKLATIWLPANRFALMSGIIMCLGMVGAMIGDVLLRALVDQLGWQTTVYCSAGGGIVLAIVLWLFLSDVNPDHPYFEHHVMDFKSVVFGLWQALTNMQIWLTGIVGFLLYLSLSAFGEMWGIPYLEQAHELQRSQAAAVNSMIFLGWAIGAPFWGLVSDMLKRRCLPIIFCSLLSLLVFGILVYVPHLSLMMLYGLMMLFGFFSAAQILIFSICREVSSIKIAGTAIALTNMIVMIGGNVFQPVIGKLLDVYWTGRMVSGARFYSVHSYEVALSVLPICIVIAIIVTLFFMRETHCEVIVESPHPKSNQLFPSRNK